MSEENKRDEQFIYNSSMENQIEEEGLEFARYFKRYLQFEIGSVVFLRSDSKRKCPMTVSAICTTNADADYVCSYTTSQRDVKRAFFKNRELTE